MPTEVVSTLKASGGDYTSIAAWITAITGTDWVTTDQIPVLECYLGDYSSVGGGVNYVTEQININVSNCDATHPVTIRAASGARTGFTPGSGFRVEKWASYGGVVVCTEHGRVEGIELKNLSTSTSHGLAGTCKTFFGSGLLLSGGTATGSSLLTSASGKITFVSTVVLGTRSTTGFYYDHHLYNCMTVASVPLGFDGAGAGNYSTTCVNCVALNATTSYKASADFPSPSGSNAADDGATTTPPGATPYTSNVVDADFVDASNGDYELSASSGLKDIGVDLSGVLGADWVDIHGTAFDTADPPIGAHQPVASGTPFTGVGSATDVDVTGNTGLLTAGVDQTGSATDVDTTGMVGSVAAGWALEPDPRSNAYAYSRVYRATGVVTTGVVATGTATDVNVDGGLGSVTAGSEGDFVGVGSAGLVETTSGAGTLAQGDNLVGLAQTLDVTGWSGTVGAGLSLTGSATDITLTGYAGDLASGTDAVLSGQASNLDVIGAAGAIQLGVSLGGATGLVVVLPKTGSLVTTEATVWHDITGSFEGLGQSAPVLVSETAINVSVWSAAGNTLVLERSFDDGTNWRTVSDITEDVEHTYGEPEDNVLYRVRVTEYVSGTISYRIGLPRPRVFCCGGIGSHFVADVGSMMN
jgi:hypothetical protein